MGSALVVLKRDSRLRIALRRAGGVVSDIVVLSEITVLGGRKRINGHSPDVRIHALKSD